MEKIFSLFVCILPLAAAWRPNILLARQASQVSQAAVQPTCPTRYAYDYTIAPTVNGQPILVSTQITANTTFTPDPSAAPITISNAPTLLNTTITAYTTTTRTVTRQRVTITADGYTGSTLSSTTYYDSVDPSASTTIILYIPSSASLSPSAGASSSVSASASPSLAPVSSSSAPVSSSPVVASSSSASASSSISFTTVTVYYTGTASSTRTLSAASSGQPGTVEIYAPGQFTTVTNTYDGPTTRTSTQNQTVASQPGTVYVQVPRSYTTVTTVYDGTAVSTSTQTPSASGSAGTAYVLYPRTYTTITSTYSGTVTQTVTTFTPTGTGQQGTVVVLKPSPSCSATGLVYNNYRNPDDGGSVNFNLAYSNFNASYFNGGAGASLFSGSIKDPSFDFGNTASSKGTNGPLYGTTREMGNSTLVYTGYFFPPTTGTYTFNTSTQTNSDIFYLWMGPAAAQNTWSETNWNLRVPYYTSPNTIFTQTFTGGQLYPIVMVLGIAVYAPVLQISVTPPSGVSVPANGWFLQPSCATSGYTINTNQPATPTTCQDTGISFVNHPNPSPGFYNPNNYNPPRVAPYNTTNFRGVVDDIYFDQPSPAIIYGSPTSFDVTYTVTTFRGYFVPNATGAWTFGVTRPNQPDDGAWVWFGQNAISAWNSTNANITNAVLAGPALNFTATLTSGTLYPIRMAFYDQAGIMNYTLITTDPNGVRRLSTAGFFQQIYCGPPGWT